MKSKMGISERAFKNVNSKKMLVQICADIIKQNLRKYIPSLCIWNCSDGVWACNILLDTVVAVTLVTATLLVDIFNICDIPVLKASWNCVVLALVELIPVAPYITSI